MTRLSKKTARTRGYTVVEVMMALSVLSIGITGIVAMQKVTLLGNTRARDLAAATALASSMIERLRYDALRWNFINTGNPATNSAPYINTQYLQLSKNTAPTMDDAIWQVVVPGTAPGTWDNNGVLGAFDVTTQDTTVAAEMAYCVNVRLTEIMYDPEDKCIPTTNCPSVLRAEVRVYWLKLYNGLVTGGTLSGAPFCDGTEVGAGTDATGLELATNGNRDGVGRYHFVHMSTTILRNDLETPP